MATADGSYTPGLVACGHMTTVAATKKLDLQRHLGGLFIYFIAGLLHTLQQENKKEDYFALTK